MMGQGWRRYGAGFPLRGLSIAASLSGMVLLMTAGCRTIECELCRRGTLERKVMPTSNPTVGLPGTPTLPPGPSAHSLSSTTPNSGLDSRSGTGSGTTGANLTSGTRRLPASPASNSGGGLISTGGSQAPLPPPQDLSLSAGGSSWPSASTPAMSNWAPATPLSSAPGSPAPVGLQEPGPLPPPPPGATGNVPVLPPTPPPGTP
jgi:hypothetical protein